VDVLSDAAAPVLARHSFGPAERRRLQAKARLQAREVVLIAVGLDGLG